MYGNYGFDGKAFDRWVETPYDIPEDIPEAWEADYEAELDRHFASDPQRELDEADREARW